MRLIDADALYTAMQDAEELARKRVLDTESTTPYPHNINPAYTRYVAQMDERTRAKEMIADAPSAQPNTCDGCKWDGAIGYGECHHCKRAFSDMYEEGVKNE